MHADFKSILKPLRDIDTTQGVALGITPSVTPYQEHIACSFAYKIVSTVLPNFSKPIVFYRGEYAADEFIRVLQREAEELLAEFIDVPQEMEFSASDEINFEMATVRHICNQFLADDRVRDHCHFIGLYRGAAHNACNLNYRIHSKSWKLPVVLHNLKGYEGHLIVQSLKSEFCKVRVIPQNMEKYLSLSVGKLQFIDSFQFTPQSLEALVETLGDDDFYHLSDCCVADSFQLVPRRGIYPYDYVDSFAKFDETSLPPQTGFFNKLSLDACSNADYTHALHVWECETLGDYHDIYLPLDVLLLTDFFEEFRKTCLNYYKLDHVHYFTTPGMAWDAALKMTGITLDLITEKDIYHLIETSIRGGVSMVTTRHAKANNLSLSSYDSSLPNLGLIYLDANNLYGHAMSQHLPTGGFQLLNDEEVRNQFLTCDINTNLASISDTADTGYILEVDLHYPDELHGAHDDYPLAPESLDIDQTMYSPIQSSMYPPSAPQRKLTPNLRDKSHYIVHYRNLKMYVKLGLVITKVHQVLTFKQSAWLKSYIDFNTHNRSLAQSDFFT